MKQKEKVRKIHLDDYVGCFGRFRADNIVCKKYCAINLRCAIEQDQNVRLELLEDLVASDDMMIQNH